MAQRYIAQDVGGFGRLADMELRLKSEKRADQESLMRRQVQGLQLQQTQANIAELGRRNEIKHGLTILNKSLPEGENQFTASYKYLMEKDPEMADKYMTSQSDRIEQVNKMDRQAGADLFNQTIGKVMNTKIAPVPGKDDLVEATNEAGEKVYLEKTSTGFKRYPLPEGMTIAESEDPILIPQEKLDYWAKQYNTTGKKVFNVRGKKANEINRMIQDHAATLQLEGGVTGEETVFAQEDRKAIQKSITAQEKQRGSMVSFVDNLAKQIDHVAKVAEEIKTFDTRMFNKPARWIKRKLTGSPELSKYEVYLGEIQSEIGKLSSGSTASVSELSEGAREKWEGILDENLSIKDMLEVLQEVKEAGNIRMESVDKGLEVSRQRLRDIGSKKKTKMFELPEDFETATDDELEAILRGE